MILIIDESHFTNRVQISNFVKLQNLHIAIYNAQEIYLKEILGEDLYSNMLLNYPSYTPIDQLLYEKIVPFLVYQSALNYFAINGITDTQSGLRIHLDEFSEPVNPAQFKTFMDFLRNSVCVAKQDLINFLNKNKDDYPDYKKKCNENSCKSVITFSSVGGSKKQKSRFFHKRFHK
ncbi:MAG: hypothetical protein QXW79_02410 [Thermoplasmata archaeon]